MVAKMVSRSGREHTLKSVTHRCEDDAKHRIEFVAMTPRFF
jgi:hypothetical protein